MLDLETAREIALKLLEELPKSPSGDWRIHDEREAPSAFIFAWTNFVDDKPTLSYGNVPMVVPKDGRDAYVTAAADIEFIPERGFVDRLKRWWIRRQY